MNRRPPGPDPFVELADRATIGDAVAARGRERDRRDRAVDTASWHGTLRDLAERGMPLVIRTAGDRVHRGVLLAVGIDHVALRLANRTTMLIADDTLRSVRAEPGSVTHVAMSDRERSQDRTLVEVLALVVEERAEVALSLRETLDPVVGTVVGLGEDVLTLRLSGSDRALTYLPLAALREIAVDG